MFNINTTVAWATKDNCFMGTVLESNSNQSVVMVTSSSHRSKLIGKKLVINNTNLGDITAGKTIVVRM